MSIRMFRFWSTIVGFVVVIDWLIPKFHCYCCFWNKHFCFVVLRAPCFFLSSFCSFRSFSLSLSLPHIWTGRVLIRPLIKILFLNSEFNFFFFICLRPLDSSFLVTAPCRFRTSRVWRRQVQPIEAHQATRIRRQREMEGCGHKTRTLALVESAAVIFSSLI